MNDSQTCRLGTTGAGSGFPALAAAAPQPHGISAAASSERLDRHTTAAGDGNGNVDAVVSEHFAGQSDPVSRKSTSSPDRTQMVYVYDALLHRMLVKNLNIDTQKVSPDLPIQGGGTHSPSVTPSADLGALVDTTA